MVAKRLQPAGPGQRCAPQGHGHAEAILPPKRTGQQDAGEEAIRDLGSGQALRQMLLCCQPDRKGGDQSGAGPGQFVHHLAQVVGRDVQVTVGDHQHVVPGRAEHVDQVRDFAVPAMLGAAYDHGDIGRRVLPMQPGDDGEGRVIGAGDAEDELKIGVILGKERGQCRL